MPTLDSDVESSHHASSLTKKLVVHSVRSATSIPLSSPASDESLDDRSSIESGGIIPYEDPLIQ
ncbi:unnamed protein product [Linum tenue]|uniref:Uncharacterized protein n=1 Tax=Linum tenue TaxID=586396 RepID=A0AAV0NWS7_9ROSI|nr:unnamed protein product [Linum tenue]